MTWKKNLAPTSTDAHIKSVRNRKTSGLETNIILVYCVYSVIWRNERTAICPLPTQTLGHFFQRKYTCAFYMSGNLPYSMSGSNILLSVCPPLANPSHSLSLYVCSSLGSTHRTNGNTSAPHATTLYSRSHTQGSFVWPTNAIVYNILYNKYSCQNFVRINNNWWEFYEKTLHHFLRPFQWSKRADTHKN